MKTIQDFTGKDVQRRPRIGLYGWVSKIYEVGETTLVLLYGTHIVGQNFYGPEYNGIAVFDDYQCVRDGIGREASGYYGPSNKQLFIFDAICNMPEEELRTWISAGCPNKHWLLPKLCPKCGTALECDVSVVYKGMPLLENIGGVLEWDEDQVNSKDAVDFDYIYCPTCDEEVDLE